MRHFPKNAKNGKYRADTSHSSGDYNDKDAVFLCGFCHVFKERAVVWLVRFNSSQKWDAHDGHVVIIVELIDKVQRHSYCVCVHTDAEVET